ncbi:MAG TPA: TolC family protein [bacterium]|nr:TolC family protein [bacterium]
MACSGSSPSSGSSRLPAARRRTAGALAASVWLWAACATVDPGPDYDEAVRAIRVATGVPSAYRPGEDRACARRVGELLEGGLSLGEAVEVALLNNPGLQGAFRSIGMARADRVQAGILSNPSLMLALRFPDGGGDTAIAGNLFGSLLDLWQIPARIDSADAALRQQILQVAHAAVALAGAVRSSYIDAVAASRQVAIADENRATAARLLELAEQRVAARAATAIDVNLARIDLATAEVALRDARLAVVEARRALAAHLGLEDLPADCALDVALADQGRRLLSGESLRILALANRLDVRAAQRAVAAAAAELERQRGRVARVIHAGAVAEKEEGEWSVGPALRLQLPVFDQNQAQIAKAADALARQQAILAGMRLDAIRDVGVAYARVEASRATARIYAEQILARSREALALAREAYRSGKSTILPVLELQRSLLTARREHLRRLQQVAIAISDLERVTGAPREAWLHTEQRKEP